MTGREAFHAQLISELKARYPHCSAAAIVGSYAFGRPFVDDVDLAIFDSQMPNGEEREDRFFIEAQRIDVAVRSPAWLEPSTHTTKDILGVLREVRKIASAIVLFDEHAELTNAIQFWRRFQIPRAILRPFYERSMALVLQDLAPPLQRCSLYYGFENVMLGWAHSEMSYRYSKPKWLLWDVEQLNCAEFAELAQNLASEACERGNPGYWSERLATLIQSDPQARQSQDLMFGLMMLRDASFLAQRDLLHGALWPLRMATYQVLKARAEALQLPYYDLRSGVAVQAQLARTEPALAQLISEILLLDQPLAARDIRLFEGARRHFGQALG